jgi:hypothetical protein
MTPNGYYTRKVVQKAKDSILELCTAWSTTINNCLRGRSDPFFLVYKPIVCFFHCFCSMSYASWSNLIQKKQSSTAGKQGHHWSLIEEHPQHLTQVSGQTLFYPT